jgi:hypothetical protein
LLKYIVIGLLFTVAALAQQMPRELTEVCSVITQQRNQLADQVALIEAKRKMAQERLVEWEAYFKAYVGNGASG